MQLGQGMTIIIWRLVALVAAILTASLAAAQTPVPRQPELGSTLTADLLRDLPTSNNLFSVLETTQPEVISDRFFSGGLNTGDAPRFGAFLGSWTQTQYRIDDINVTDPAGNGSPLLFPELAYWQRVTTRTGLMPVDINAPALVVTLKPERPAASWMRVIDGSVSGSPLIATPARDGPPAVDRLSGWKHASVLVSGPVIRNRLGLVAAGTWTDMSHVERFSQTTTRNRVGSAFAHLVFTTTPRDEVRGLGWVQRAATTAFTDTSVHTQSNWERREPTGTTWRIFGGYTQRVRTPTPQPSPLFLDSVTSGPVSDQIDSAAGTDRRWTIGGHVVPASRRSAFGVDVDGVEARITPTAMPQIVEVVDGLPARLWQYHSARANDHRHATTIAAYASDRVTLATPRLTLDAGLRFEAIRGAANGGLNSIGWQTWLPRAIARWDNNNVLGLAFTVGYRRTAYQLPLSVLAVGDPAAPFADVYLWNGATPGPLIARVGPGTGGDPSFGRVDPQLRRPYTDEIVLALESQPTSTVRLRLAGIAKREQHLIRLMDVGAPASAYTLMSLADPAPDSGNPNDARLLPVYNRPPASFGLDRYILTNQPGNPATFAGLEVTAQASTDRWLLVLGGTASRALGPAANVGFLPTENDQDVLGNLRGDPNESTYARGRLFSDRAYTLKLATTYHWRRDVALGVIARYQDGQPFARLVIVPGLNQGPVAIRAAANGSSRFTYTGTLDLRLQKGFTMGGRRLTAMIDVFNLPNLTNETQEIVVGGSRFRTPTAVQPPRTVLVGVRFTL
jgi:hypothetical protein